MEQRLLQGLITYIAPMSISRLLLAATALFAFTGCITIEENYTFKKDGSGTMTYVVDLTELGDMLKTMGDMGVGKDEKDGEMGAMDLGGGKGALEKIGGITKVKLDTKKKWIQKLSFRFEDVNALNLALNVLMPDSSGLAQEFFRWDNGTLIRTNNRHAFEMGAGMAGAGGEEENGEEGEGGFDMATMLGSMKYKYSFKFKQAISEVSSADGVEKVNMGSKAVNLSTDWSVISKDPKALDLRIVLDR